MSTQQLERFVEESFLPFIAGDLSAGDLVGLSVDDIAKLMQLGISSLSAGRLDNARKVFQLVADLKPDLYMSHHYLGIVEEKANRLEDAAVAYERAGALLEALPVRSKEQDSIMQDIAFSLAVVFLRLDRPREGGEYLLELYAERESLEPTLRLHVEAYLSRLGIIEQ